MYADAVHVCGCCAGVTGSVGVLCHACITQMAGLIESSMLGSHR